MQNSLVIGASRGLGRGFVTQLLARGDSVLATVRKQDDAEALRLLPGAKDRLEIFELDVALAESRANFGEALGERSIDTVIHNAGIYGPKGVGLGELPEAEWQQVLHIDTIAPILTAQVVLPHLQRAAQSNGFARIAFLTSLMGSIGDNGSGGSYLYRSAKAGLNAAARSLSIDLAGDQVGVLLLHPGWVATDMGGLAAPLQIDESVAGMLQQIGSMQLANSGSFCNLRGDRLPW